MAEFRYPPVGFYFKVEIDGFPGDIGFQSVDGLKAKIEETPFKEGGENTYSHRHPNPVSYGDLTLKRGVLIGSSLIKWFDDAIQNFEFDPRDVSVTLLNSAGQPLEQWIFRNAWPKAWDIDSLDAMSSTKVLSETITLAYQYFKRVGLPAQ